MTELVTLIAAHGVLLVFANVLVEQLGLPVPAIPTLVVAGALSMDGSLSATAVFAAAFLASMVADSAWFIAGRIYGHRVMKLLCRISLSPDSCVRQTESHFVRWGGLLLPLSKFLPGLATVAPPLAGAMRLSWPAFLFWSAIGAALWSGVAIGVGMLFHTQVSVVLERIEEYGMRALLVVAALFAAYIALKWWQRARFLRMLRVARISVDELHDLMAKRAEPVVVDVRAAATRQLDPRFIPGALAIDMADVPAKLAGLSRDRDIIFYCTCPNEASAAAIAKQLVEAGYTRVRPLLGGLDAWADAGHAIERR